MLLILSFVVGISKDRNVAAVIKKPAKEASTDKPIQNVLPKENKDTVTNPFDVRSGSTDFKSVTTDLGKQRILKRNNSKLGLKRSRTNIDTSNDVSTKVARSSSDFIDSKLKTRTVKPLKGSQQKQDESSVKFRKDSFDDDLDDIDLDIGVEVEDAPLSPAQKVCCSLLPVQSRSY